MKNILDIKNRRQFREWLMLHSETETSCWVDVKRGRPQDDDVFYYLDAVEEALCFGWIDSRQKLINGRRMQRFSPRKKYSPWTELNKERVRRLEKLGLMTDAGRAVLPPYGSQELSDRSGNYIRVKRSTCMVKISVFPSPLSESPYL
ncbi:MAG: hypothetical protein IKG15_04980 [Solobacterium sp.]|nr:hypothetical protein [Solobacterium sp.]